MQLQRVIRYNANVVKETACKFKTPFLFCQTHLSCYCHFVVAVATVQLNNLRT